MHHVIHDAAHRVYDQCAGCTTKRSAQGLVEYTMQSLKRWALGADDSMERRAQDLVCCVLDKTLRTNCNGMERAEPNALDAQQNVPHKS